MLLDKYLSKFLNTKFIIFLFSILLFRITDCFITKDLNVKIRVSQTPGP